MMTEKVAGKQKRGRIFVVSAPAGTGKTTLVEMLTEEFPNIVQSVSFTTRKPRPGEKTGVHYHFISRADFAKKIAAGEFLEHVHLYGDSYGTSAKWVAERLKKGKHVVLVIDTQGGLLLKKKKLPEAVFIFIRPPSFSALRKRLDQRKTESKAMIAKRIAWARKEMKEGLKYDYQIINDDLHTAYEILKSIVIAEEHRLH